MKELYQEVLDFLWTRQQDGEKIQKRRLVAKDRISASFNKGGLQVPHPSDTAEGLHLNMLQKIYNRIQLPHSHNFPLSNLPSIMEETLRDARCPTFLEHLVCVVAVAVVDPQGLHTAVVLRRIFLFTNIYSNTLVPSIRVTSSVVKNFVREKISLQGLFVQRQI
jgi:hypothetical protein